LAALFSKALEKISLGWIKLLSNKPILKVSFLISALRLSRCRQIKCSFFLSLISKAAFKCYTKPITRVASSSVSCTHSPAIFSVFNQQLLAKAIGEISKVNKVKGIDFSKKMQSLVEKYNERKEDDVLRSEVYEEMAEHLTNLIWEVQKEFTAGS
jgi:hypothetical protein